VHDWVRNWLLSSQYGHKGAVKAISDAYDPMLPKIPEPPGKVSRLGVQAWGAGGMRCVCGFWGEGWEQCLVRGHQAVLSDCTAL
jgi:hypothetical protein